MIEDYIFWKLRDSITVRVTQIQRRPDAGDVERIFHISTVVIVRLCMLMSDYGTVRGATAGKKCRKESDEMFIHSCLRIKICVNKRG